MAISKIQASSLETNATNLVHIKTITLTSNTTPIQFLNSDADVTFDTTYDTYKFIGNVRHETDGKRTYIRISEDGININSTSGNYESNDISVHDGNVSGGSDQNSTVFFFQDQLSGNATGENIAFEMTLFNNDVGSSRFVADVHYIRQDADDGLTFRGGRYMQNVRVKGISFFPSGSTNFQTGSTISMYGVKS
jgi:hypothetical protein